MNSSYVTGTGVSALCLRLYCCQRKLIRSRGKGNPGRSRSSNGSKIVLTLLTEVVVVHVGLSTVYVRGTGLQLLPGVLATMGAGVRTGAGAGTGAGARTGAGAGTGARTSRKSLRIFCKLSSEYLGTLVLAGALATGGFAPEVPASWSDNSLPDSGGGKESGRATEGAAEECLRRRRPRPRTEVIFELISSKTLFQTDWLTRWIWRN